MRNLKRALSLTLASVMLLGMMVLGTSAASYPDVDDNDNVEAIEVLQAIGVMSGSNSGNFNPDSKVTRIEMAIVMANLLDLDVDYFQGQNQFSDVPAWASGYVNACAASGIVTGVGGGRFGTGNVTATQAALMMLKALGYFQYNSDFNGDWARATALQASRIGLFKDIKAQDNTQLDRNQVAQLALNTLQATMVDAEDNTLHITTGETAGNLNISGGQVKYIVRTSDDAKIGIAIKTNASTGTSSGQLQGQTLELGEQLYQGDLKREEKGTTATNFGDPAVKWTYKSREIGTYAKSADLTYVKDVKLKDIYKDLGLSSSLTTTYLRNNGTATGTKGESLANVDLTDTGDNGDIKIGGKGTQIKVYLIDGNPDTVKVIMTDYYLAQATEDYDSGKEELRIDMQSASKDLSASNSTLKLEDFPAIANVKEDDYLVVTIINGEVKSAVPAQVVSEVTVSGARANDYVNTSEAKYEYNELAKTDTEVGLDLIDGTTDYSINNSTYNLYLDPHGYVLGVKSAKGEADVSEYLYVKDVKEDVFDVAAKVVFTDGTDATVIVSKVGSADATKDNVAKNKFYTFKTTSSGKYELTTVDNAAPGDNKVAQGSASSAYLTNKAQPIRTGSADGAVHGSAKYSANANTVFIAKDKAYVGVKNAPDVKTASTVYYVLDRNDRLLIVYTGEKGANSTSAEDLVYILNATTERRKDGDDWYYLYKAIDKGEKVEDFAANDNNKAPGLYEVSSYTDGRADLDNPPIADSSTNELVNYLGVIGSADYKEPTLTLGGTGFVLAENYKIRTVDGNTVESIGPGSVKKAVEDGFRLAYAIETSTSDDSISLVILVKTNSVSGGGTSDVEDTLTESGKGTFTDTTLSTPLTVGGDQEATFKGELTGKITTGTPGSGEDAPVVKLNNVTVKGTVDLTEAEGVTGTVTVPGNGTLKLADDADVEVTVKPGAAVEVPKGGEATITFDGTQTAPVKITGTENTDEFNSADFKASVTAMLPEGGQVDLTGIKNDSIYNPTWGMVNLVIPEGTKNIVIGIYDSDDTLVALTGDTTAAAQARGAMLIGLTTKPLNQGCFEWAKDGGTDSITPVSLTDGTYTYKVFNSTVTWGDKIGSTNNYKAAGTFTDTDVILSGEFTVR